MNHRLVMVVVLCLGLSGPALGRDKAGYSMSKGMAFNKCSEYLAAYGQSGLRREGGRLKAKRSFLKYLGFFDGYMTAVNTWKIGETDWYDGLDAYDVAAWLSSWCRDNRSENISAGMAVLYGRRSLGIK